MRQPISNISTTYTGQYSHIIPVGDTADFGLMFYSEASLWDNARWYDPALGRFAQADTIVPDGAQGLDRYAYVNNSPMNYVDPSGHESVCGQANSDPECGDLGHSELSHPSGDKDNPGKEEESEDAGQACNGNNWSILCNDSSVISTGIAISDPVFPTREPPPNWEGGYSELTGHPLVSGLILLVDLSGNFTYSELPSRYKDDYLYGVAKYNVRSTNFGVNVREPSVIGIFNNTGSNYSIQNIRTDYYSIQNASYIIEPGKSLGLYINHEGPLPGDTIYIDLSYKDMYAQIKINLYGK